MARAVGLLNARKVETLNKTGRHADGGNLYLSISPNGGKRWVFLYTRNGKKREIETVLLSLTGDIDLKQISKLTNKMDLPGGKHLEKAGEKKN